MQNELVKLYFIFARSSIKSALALFLCDYKWSVFLGVCWKFRPRNINSKLVMSASFLWLVQLATLFLCVSPQKSESLLLNCSEGHNDSSYWTGSFSSVHFSDLFILFICHVKIWSYGYFYPLCANESSIASNIEEHLRVFLFLSFFFLFCQSYDVTSSTIHGWIW